MSDYEDDDEYGRDIHVTADKKLCMRTLVEVEVDLNPILREIMPALNSYLAKIVDGDNKSGIKMLTKEVAEKVIQTALRDIKIR